MKKRDTKILQLAELYDFEGNYVFILLFYSFAFLLVNFILKEKKENIFLMKMKSKWVLREKKTTCCRS